jgi:flavin-dependent dehydrogenase
MPGWSFSGPRLFHGDKIMAGTISGLFDPIMGFGIVGAIYSGKIAAMAVYSPEEAKREFREYTKNWHSNYLSRKMMDRIPFRTGIMKFLLINGSDKRKRKLMTAMKLTIPGVDAYPLMKIVN